MAVYVKGDQGTTYTPHPEGAFPAVCCDVQDLGWEETTYGWKYKIRLVFFCGQHTDEKEVEGVKKRFPMTVSKKFTASLNEKANLRAFCKSWRGGKDFDAETIKNGFDFEKMLGADAFIQVSHFDYQGSKYAGIDTIMGLPKGTPGVPFPTDFKRLKDREDWKGPAQHPAMSQPDASEKPAAHRTDDDDLPFAPLRLTEPLAPFGW